MRPSYTHTNLHADEEESVFISMTDLTVSFLFIVMILLAFFASQFRPQDLVSHHQLDEALARLAVANTRIKTLEHENEELRRLLEELRAHKKNEIALYNRSADRARKQILLALKDRVEAVMPELDVTISDAGDILRFEGDAFFDTGKFTFKSRKIKRVVDAVADALADLLPCFTVGMRSGYSSDCNPGAVIVDAVQVEGHTDAVGKAGDNLELSLDRGATTYLRMEKHRRELLQMLNLAGQPVLSVSGYGETRPIAADSRETRSLNRRIDLRFIMASVDDIAEIEQIRTELSSAAAGAFDGLTQ